MGVCFGVGYGDRGALARTTHALTHVAQLNPIKQLFAKQEGKEKKEKVRLPSQTCAQVRTKHHTLFRNLVCSHVRTCLQVPGKAGKVKKESEGKGAAVKREKAEKKPKESPRALRQRLPKEEKKEEKKEKQEEEDAKKVRACGCGSLFCSGSRSSG